MSQQNNIVVTGGAGFVGSNLVAEVMRRLPNAHIIVIDSFRSGSFANIVEACERHAVGPFRGEVIARSAAEVDWDDAISSFSPRAVFHLGAITDTTVADEAEMLRENVVGFEASKPGSMLMVCSRLGIPLVYASSAATYGTPPQTAERRAFPLEAAGSPNNIYGFSKWLMEQQHAACAREHPNALIVGLRYFNVFGPGEARKGKMASMVYQLASQLLAGKSPRLFRDGEQARDQVYVDDVVDCTLIASGLFSKGHQPRPGVYNLGSGVTTSFNAIIAGVRNALGLAPGSLPTDYFDMPPSIRAFYQDFTLADMTRTREGLGWAPKWAPNDAITTYARYLMARAGR